MKNFRQYIGEQHVTFSYNNSQNVTVILGDNTSGKTTLVQAFSWALYGLTSFTTKDVLNQDIIRQMNVHEEASVDVEVELTHDEIDYVITRTQKYTCDARGIVHPAVALQGISYKMANGQMELVRGDSKRAETISEILPKDLSGYFFFDGERIENISSQQDVTASVKGLLGLTVLENAIKHLDPSKKTSVIGKFNSYLDLAGDEEAKQIAGRIESNHEMLNVLVDKLSNIDRQIAFFSERKGLLQDILKENESTAKMQHQKEDLEKWIENEQTQVNSFYGSLVTQFNSNTALYFSQSLMLKALKLLKTAHVADKGIPNMNATSIDFIINRKRCICGAEIIEGTEAYYHLLEEREFLPPQSIGTVIHNFLEQISTYSSAVTDFGENIKMMYTNVLKSKQQIAEWHDDVDQISRDIKGRKDAVKVEKDLEEATDNLRKFQTDRDRNLQDQATVKTLTGSLQKRHDNLIAVSKKNNKLLLYRSYAEAAYTWFKEAYDAKDLEIRYLLEAKVNEIFSLMYHGRRKVSIDEKYRVSLFTLYDDNTSVKTDESRGLETVKNFAFVAGLVELAREKIIQKHVGDQELPLSSEPYPLVMDAPFSNADERHVSNISRLLPQIAEQVIMVIMDKDWGFAETVMGPKVGKRYRLIKDSETVTHIEELS